VPSRNYQDLIAWQKAVEYVQVVYLATRSFPADERFGLTSQLRRSAVSVPSNIAEGQGRGTPPEFARFLRVAHGSLRESETNLIIAKRLGFLDPASADSALALAGEVGRLIQALTKSTAARNADE
jgi:four helix bundle protein